MITGAPVNVLDYGVKGDGITDDTSALATLFASIDSNTTVIFPAGIYLYQPVLGGPAAQTSHGFLTITGKTNITIIGYGAIIKNKDVVTIAGIGANDDVGFVLKFQYCTNIKVLGVTVDGNRNAAYGVNGDGNEFYHGITIQACSRVLIKDCKFENCQGDGAYIGCIFGSSSVNDFSYDVTVTNCFISKNRRQGISIGAAIETIIDGNIISNIGYGVGTNPKAGIDLEWEGTTLPLTTNGGTVISNNIFEGSMDGGALYIYAHNGVLFTGNTLIELTGNSIYLHGGSNTTITDNIVISNNIITGVNGIQINDFTHSVLFNNNYVSASSSPVYINCFSDNYRIKIDGNLFVGESPYGIRVIAGYTTVTNNTFYNCGSGGAGTYMALFKGPTVFTGNIFYRNTDASAPDNGWVFTNQAIVLGNSYFGVAITNPIVYGDASYVGNAPNVRTSLNIWNSASIQGTVDPNRVVDSQIIDLTTTATTVGFIPNNETIVSAEYVAISATSADGAASIGNLISSTAYMPLSTIPVNTGGGSCDIVGLISTPLLTNGTPVLVTTSAIVGAGQGLIRFETTLSPESLYISSGTFS